MNGQTAVITGASSGIGQAIAGRLAERGYATILLARRLDRLETLAEELRHHAPSRAVALDLGDASAVERVAQQIAAQDPVAVLINAGGAGACAPFLDIDADRERALLQALFHAPATLIRHILPGMLERRHGHVINIASISAKMGPCGHGPYAAAKAALTALTQSLAADYAGQGVHFSYVNPGVVRTAFFDGTEYAAMREQVRRHGIDVGPVADATVGLLDRPRLELCIPRHYRVLDLVKAISPGLCHRLVARSSRPT